MIRYKVRSLNKINGPQNSKDDGIGGSGLTNGLFLFMWLGDRKSPLVLEGQVKTVPGSGGRETRVGRIP